MVLAKELNADFKRFVKVLQSLFVFAKLKIA
jgi:hypothetical protein